MNPNITPEFIILITIIFLLLLYIFRQYKIIGKLERDIDFKNRANDIKLEFLADQKLSSSYANFINEHGEKNRIKEIEPSE
jgi:predicted Holliday junction resolvase-like endonuclease